MKYELTLLLPDEVEAKTVKETIDSFKGKIAKEEKWERKTLAYQIKKNGTHTSAYFLHWVIDIEDKNVQELRKKLNFNEKLIRFLLLKIN